jgi:predicted permease
MLAAFLTRAAVFAFPKPLRDRIGRPLAQTLLDDSRTASGRLAAGRLAAGTIDIVRAGLAERMAFRRRTRLRATGASARQARPMVDLIGQDLRYAARRLNRSRGFTFVALLTLALGIGANTAIFQLLDAVRLRPLPVHRPEELAEIRIRNFATARGDFSIWHAGATNAIWEQIRDRQDAFTGVFAWSGSGIGYGDGPSRKWLSTLLVSGSFFPVLGVQPLHGRLLMEADDTRGCSAPGTVLSYEFWQKEFGGDPAVVGRTMTLSRYPFQVVGVAPRQFTGLEVGRRFDLAIPLCAEWLPPGSHSRLDSGTDWFLIVMGRRKPGVDLAGATASLAAISPAVFETSLPGDYPAENVKEYRAFQLEALDGRTGISMLRAQYAGALWFLQATAALVLLVGCANLANLMLARAASRERELAARVALGAGRGHVIRMLLAESLLLSVIGAALGAWLAKGLSVALVKFLDGGGNSLFLTLPFDWRLFGFITLAAVTTCVLCGMAPAFRGARVAPADVLRTGSRGTTDGGPRLGLRQILVTAQVALSLILLVGALLFARSLVNLLRVDLGFRPDGVTLAWVDMSPADVPVERRREFRQHVLDTLDATPGVVAASVTSVIPLTGTASDNEVWLDGIPSPVRAVSFFAEIDVNYFRTMDIGLVEGRAFDRRDVVGAPLTAIVNEAFVRRFVPDGRVVGRRVWREARAGGVPATLYDIVGVVKDAKYRELREQRAPTIYLPDSQDPRPGTFAQMVIRTSLSPGAVEPALKDAFRRAGPAIVPAFSDFRRTIQRTLTQDQMLAALSGFFGLFAVILATVGLYGSMSFVVARRTRELGIRIALGARRDGILRLVLSEAGRLVLVGCVIGGALAVVLSTFVRALIYALEPHDPWTMAGAVLLVMIVGLLACLGPALRAARVDPVVAFKAE